MFFDGKGIKQEKQRIKKKIGTKARGQRGSSEENGTMQIEGDKGKKKSRLPNFRQIFPLNPDLPIS